MSKWMIDPDHSVAAFAIRHMMIAFVRGQFNKITGTIQFDPEDITRSSVEMEIDVASLTSGIKKRDEHLLSADFFEVEKYPKITFKSMGIEKTGTNSGKVTGDLTIHGVTRSVTLEVSFFGPVKSPFGETSMGFSAATSLNREGFGIMWNEPMEKGGLMIGRDVEITVDIEADLAE
ncbi:MAG: YceI family protein [Nitrospirota bacterium]